MIGGIGSNLLVLIAAGAVAVGVAAWIRGEMTDEDRPFREDDWEDRGA